jgi:hypothetical protein
MEEAYKERVTNPEKTSDRTPTGWCFAALGRGRSMMRGASGSGCSSNANPLVPRIH